jgi:hypothetical protein
VLLANRALLKPHHQKFLNLEGQRVRQLQMLRRSFAGRPLVQLEGKTKETELEEDFARARSPSQLMF